MIQLIVIQVLKVTQQGFKSKDFDHEKQHSAKINSSKHYYDYEKIQQQKQRVLKKIKGKQRDLINTLNNDQLQCFFTININIKTVNSQIIFKTMNINLRNTRANKENVSVRANTVRSITSHPSQQSDCRAYKPTIKVGYSIIPSTVMQPRRTKKKVEMLVNRQQNQFFNRRKNMGRSQNQSGKFQGCQYKPRQSVKSIQFLRKSVQNAQEKYYNSKQIQQQLRFQGRKSESRRTTVTEVSTLSKNNLPGYQSQGIKDILQYQHAGKYRDIKVTQKCTSLNGAQGKFVKYSDLHEFDFRKRPQNLR